MNKNIKLEIAIGIILIIAVIIGGFIWLGNKQTEKIATLPETNQQPVSLNSKSSQVAIPTEKEEIKECGSDKIICPDGILIKRMQNEFCNFPSCAKGKYDMNDLTLQVYQSEKYAIEFKYPKSFMTSEFTEHENKYGGDLVVDLKSYLSKKDQEDIKLYFSKDLSKYPDIAKTVAEIRKDTGLVAVEIHNFGTPQGFEGYYINTYSDSKTNKTENYQFLKLDNGFFYFKDLLTQSKKDSSIYNIISTFRSINY